VYSVELSGKWETGRYSARCALRRKARVVPINPCADAAGVLLVYNEESVNDEIITMG